VIGTEVVMTGNITTDPDITNGARGTIADVIPNPEEPSAGTAPSSHRNIFRSVLVKLNRPRAVRLEGVKC